MSTKTTTKQRVQQKMKRKKRTIAKTKQYNHNKTKQKLETLQNNNKQQTKQYGIRRHIKNTNNTCNTMGRNTKT